MSKRIASQPIPSEHKHNFRLFALDNLGVGVINGSIISFLVVYATRIGASSLQIGLINAVPALVSLLIALPAGAWLYGKSLKRALVGSAILFRFQYLLLVLVPFLDLPAAQLCAIIAVIFVTSLPATLVTISFNAFFADMVPLPYRAYVAGRRMMTFSIANVTSTIVCGLLLDWLPFKTGYQLVFFIGFLGAIFSTLALSKIKPLEEFSNTSNRYAALQPETHLTDHELHKLKKKPNSLRPDILKTGFTKYLMLMFVFHLFVAIPAPIFPVFTVRNLNLSDFMISIGYAVFYVAVLLASQWMNTLTSKFGTKAVMGAGAALMCAYPLCLATGKGMVSLMAASIFGGIGWAYAGGMMYNFILEKMPDKEKPPYLAWYNLVFNLALLVASLTGGLVGDRVGLLTALIIFGLGRLFSGLLILRWG